MPPSAAMLGFSDLERSLGIATQAGYPQIQEILRCFSDLERSLGIATGWKCGGQSSVGNVSVTSNGR